MTDGLQGSPDSGVRHTNPDITIVGGVPEFPGCTTHIKGTTLVVEDWENQPIAGGAEYDMSIGGNIPGWDRLRGALDRILGRNR